MTTAKQEKILIIQPLPGIGDTVWFLPHLFSLRKQYPKASITLLTKKRSKADQILKDQKIIDNFIWLERKPGKHSGFLGFFKLVKDLKKENFNKAWVLHKSCEYALACKLSKIPKIYAYGRGYSKFFVTPPHLSVEDMQKHPIDRATALLEAHNILLQGLETVTIEPKKELIQVVNKKTNLNPDNKNIVLCIGGSEAYKKWPDGHFKKVAKIFLEKNCKVFVLGGPQEEREANLIAKEIHEEDRLNINVVTNLSIPEVVCFISQIDLFIGNDTGMLNLAAAIGKPSIGLFGQTPALTYRKNLHPIIAPDSAEGKKVCNIIPDQVISLSKNFVDL